jgi:hypothetical protein
MAGCDFDNRREKFSAVRESGGISGSTAEGFRTGLLFFNMAIEDRDFNTSEIISRAPGFARHFYQTGN